MNRYTVDLTIEGNWRGTSEWPEVLVERPDGSEFSDSWNNKGPLAHELNVLWAMVQYLASAPQQLQALGQDACIAAAREWAEAVEKEAPQ